MIEKQERGKRKKLKQDEVKKGEKHEKRDYRTNCGYDDNGNILYCQ